MKEPTKHPESLESNTDEYDDILDDDYGIILDRNGNLKSVFLPENTDDVPEVVLEILKIFDIDSLESLQSPTVTVH